MKIAYLGSDYIDGLDFESPSCLTENPEDRNINGNKNMRLAVLEHPETLFYSLDGFVEAFNEECISDLGMIVLCEDDKKTLFGDFAETSMFDIVLSKNRLAREVKDLNKQLGVQVSESVKFDFDTIEKVIGDVNHLTAREILESDMDI